LTHSADGAFNGFARERAVHHQHRRNFMRRRHALVLSFVFACSSLSPWPAAGAPPSRSSESQADAPAGPAVNINTAGVKELMKLEGVGRQVAEKIVAYRDAHGPFKKPEELRKVEGVGSGLWERNRTRIVVK
jgi:competence protein ComEA